MHKIEDMYYDLKYFIEDHLRWGIIGVVSIISVIIIGIFLFNKDDKGSVVQDTSISWEDRRQQALAEDGILSNYVSSKGIKGDGLYIVYRNGGNKELFESVLSNYEGQYYLYRGDLEQESLVYYPSVLSHYAKQSGKVYNDSKQLPDLILVKNGVIIKERLRFDFKNSGEFNVFIGG